MKAFLRIGLLGGLLVGLLGVGFGSPAAYAAAKSNCSGGVCKLPTKSAKAKPGKKIVSTVCPVMGNSIPDVRKAAGKSVYKGKTYYFCCPACKPMFDKNPQKYIKKNKK